MKLNQQTFQTYALLYIDNELSAEERLNVEAFVQANPAIKEEFQLLQSLVLNTPAIVFEDKALLYRHDELEATLDSSFKQSLYKKEPSIIKHFGLGNPFIKYASIAAIAILIVGSWIQFINPSPSISKKGLVDKVSTVKNTPQTNYALTQSTEQHNITNNSVALINATSKKYSIDKKPDNKISSLDIHSTQNTPQELVANLNESILPSIEAPMTTSSMSNIETQAAPKDMNGLNENNVLKESFEEINTDDNERIIYISNFEIDGDKLRGLARRVNAIFKRNKTDKN
jgi:hypothetical protein